MKAGPHKVLQLFRILRSNNAVLSFSSSMNMENLNNDEFTSVRALRVRSAKPLSIFIYGKILFIPKCFVFSGLQTRVVVVVYALEFLGRDFILVRTEDPVLSLHTTLEWCENTQTKTDLCHSSLFKLTASYQNNYKSTFWKVCKADGHFWR